MGDARQAARQAREDAVAASKGAPPRVSVKPGSDRATVDRQRWALEKARRKYTLTGYIDAARRAKRR